MFSTEKLYHARQSEQEDDAYIESNWVKGLQMQTKRFPEQEDHTLWVKETLHRRINWSWDQIRPEY